MLIHKGACALSQFRQARLLRQLQAIDAGVRDVQARYWHFIDTPKTELDERIARLLEGGEAFVAPEEGELFLVLPRFGTISAWSSKATDILRQAGCEQVLRVERGTAFWVRHRSGLDTAQRQALEKVLHDRMTQVVVTTPAAAEALFSHQAPRPLRRIALLEQGRVALEQANREQGFALSDEEIDYLVASYRELGRDPSDVELMMFAQANSEHCRHKIFNASWQIDGQPVADSLFAMIRHTHAQAPAGVLSAYSDNSAVIAGPVTERWVRHAEQAYAYHHEPVHILMKVETHNHPTAIAPFAGAATGAGGEIRDEGATGRGAKPKAGLTGFSVSNLRLPEAVQAWEGESCKPDRIASPLEIMIQGPLGGAAFNNEFGRPNLCGYFRTYEQRLSIDGREQHLGYHKPIMIAGGYGNIRAEHVHKQKIPAGALLIVLGGPALLIGLGGGAASSMNSGSSAEDMDFASVQRDNPEMERRCQEVIDACWALAEANPIISIHDVGAGGLSNALPELVHENDLGAQLQLREIPLGESGLSPLEIWCNEAQERYVLAVSAESLPLFQALCERERCPYAVLGTATQTRQLVVNDRHFGVAPVDMPMQVLLGKPPRMQRSFQRQQAHLPALDLAAVTLPEAIDRLLHLPTIASKAFLITIGDRSVGGLVAREQMVGPWQVPVADCAVTAASFRDVVGEAMAMGERTPVAIIDAAQSARLAVAEAITNLMAADVRAITDIRLSANWMAAAGHPGEDQKLYEAVAAIGMDFCPQLGICIPVGKDSLSMRTQWQQDGQNHVVTAPMSLIISAFAPVADVRKTWTPQLRLDAGDSELLLLDLSSGGHHLGASCLAQVYGQLGQQAADVNAADLKAFVQVMCDLRDRDLVLAYHDRSDGGLLVAALEMAFAGHAGLDLVLAAPSTQEQLAQLFHEGPGVLLQVAVRQRAQVQAICAEHGLAARLQVLGRVEAGDDIVLRSAHTVLFQAQRHDLQRAWSETSFRLQSLRDHAGCAQQEYDRLLDRADTGLHAHLAFDPAEDVAAPYIERGARPQIAILREQGVNGHMEMAAAFDRAGFAAIDVHMSDLLAGRDLQAFQGLVACGGFSYGDVLGAGGGWARSVLFHEGVRQTFAHFFARAETFTLGVCNGCQMLAQLRDLIPGADLWPRFERNLSEQFEARTVMVEVQESPSILLRGMQGSRLPVAVAHGEGRAVGDVAALTAAGLVGLRYVDYAGRVSERYPDNPNGSPQGLTAVTSRDGRATIMMPHPERVFRTLQHAWAPSTWGEDAPWLRMFRNARIFVA